MDTKEKEFSRKVAQDLQNERLRKQVTQKMLAEQMKTTKSAISRLEKGEQNITLETAAKYAYALGSEPVFRVAADETEDDAPTAAKTGLEPFSEVLAWQVARRMKLNAVPCELVYRNGMLTVKNESEAAGDVSFVPAEQLVETGDIRSCLAFYRTLGEDFHEHLCSMLVFDALIYNEGRCFGNFGLLRDGRTERFTAPAPISGNSSSLFCYGTPEDFKNLQEYAAARKPACGGSFEGICGSVMGPLQKDQLRSMINFRFEDTEPVCLPSRRIRAIETQLQRRVYQLLHL
jgi:transcriptional regulator with XRE-family HTH domain